MIPKVLTQLNWVDVIFIVLFLKVCYTAAKSGLIAEFFKFLGTVAAVYFALHYYVSLGDWAIRLLAIEKERIPVDFVAFLCFLVLAIASYVVIAIVRNMFTRAVKMEAVVTLERWGGLLLGVVRGVLLCSLLAFALSIATIQYFKKSVDASYFGSRSVGIAPQAYACMWDSLASKFMLNEKFNDSVKK